jgi:hypothetical protein
MSITSMKVTLGNDLGKVKLHTYLILHTSFRTTESIYANSSKL